MRKFLLLFLAIIITCSALKTQPNVTFQPVISSGLTSPTDVVNAGDNSGRLFLVEKTGTIKVWNGTALLSTPFLNVRSLLPANLGSEQGLLSLAFHPAYSTNGYFFIYYTNTSGAITVARYRTTSNDPNVADETSGVVLMTIPKPFANHNGGDLNFGSDGYLYFGTGDGGSGGDPFNNAQNGNSLLGKMLRIDVNGFNTAAPFYAIPSTNPYINDPDILDEIVNIGLRNPWRYSFDRQTGDMWIADVGQDEWEEVNYRRADSILNNNYGWKCYEGTHVYGSGCSPAPNSVVPVFDYPHNSTAGGFSITGGFVYRAAEFPVLQGYYLCVDYVTGRGWLIKSNSNGGWNITQQTWPLNISSFGEAEDGKLYATGLNGFLYKVIADQPLPLKLVSFTGTTHNNLSELSWKVNDENRGDVYIIESAPSPQGPFTEATSVTANASQATNIYRVTLSQFDSRYYRLKLLPGSGQALYSSLVFLKVNSDGEAWASVTGSQLNIIMPKNAGMISLYDAAGRLLLKQKVINSPGTMSFSLANIARGALFISIQQDNSVQNIKVVW